MDTNPYLRTLSARVIGRLFTIDGLLHMVLEVDEASGMARCSRRDSGSGCTTMLLPVTEVCYWLQLQQNPEEQADAS